MSDQIPINCLLIRPNVLFDVLVPQQEKLPVGSLRIYHFLLQFMLTSQVRTSVNTRLMLFW